MRVHELAKELGLSSKELIDLLGRMKVVVKSHSSSLDESTVRRAREQLARQGAEPRSEPAAAPRAEARTPTGERILSIRKIAAPPPLAEEPAPPPAASASAEAVKEPPTEAVAGEAERKESMERPAAKGPAAPAPPRVAPKAGEAAPPPIRIAPVKPPTREAAREVVRPEEIAQIIEPAAAGPPAPSGVIHRPGPRPARPFEAPKRPERRLPPPPPPRRFHAARRPRRAGRRTVETSPEQVAVLPQEIELTGPVAVGDLASKMGLGVADVVKRLLEFGMLAGINQQLSQELATRTVESFGVSILKAREAVANAEVQRPAAVAEEGAVARAPIVTVMGHVDHGKTTLLDVIRTTSVAAGEIGGITQHIGASTVEADGRKIVFIDTPGHEAFTTLRARGARVTDIAVLVVAADDGVMPQTVEAVSHARAAGVPIIVALNKIDLPQVNPDRVKQQLSDLGLVPEEWGGDTVTVQVSARQGTGVRDLLEMILLVAELHEVRVNPDKPARGTILEARMDRGRGPVATVLIQEGTLRIGDAITAGETLGRVRALMDEHGLRLGAAGPATPVEVVGLESIPNAGDLLEVASQERQAKAITEERQERRRAVEAAARTGILEERVAEESHRELRLVLKADVHGSVEALQASLARLGIPEVGLKILHAAVGPITESDVMLAAASRASIVGFNVRPDASVRRLAEQEKVDLRLYRIIYEALDDLGNLVRGLRPPKRQEVVLGQAEVRQIFAVPKVGTVAGCYVTSGRMLRGASVRLLREGVITYEGAIGSLRRFKEDVREVTEEFECGIGLERFKDVKVGDIIEAYAIEEVPA